MGFKNYTDQEVIEAVRSSFSVRSVLRILGLSPTGSNYKTMQVYFLRLGVDISHFTGQGHLKGKNHNWNPKRPLSEILVKNSDFLCSSKLKRRLIREGLLTNHCYECDSPPEWRGKPLVMILDHINGDRIDNRLENLRLLCPNCNSQQGTFAGRNNKRNKSVNGQAALCT